MSMLFRSSFAALVLRFGLPQAAQVLQIARSWKCGLQNLLRPSRGRAAVGESSMP